ncbi:hypothetical protein ASG11_07785 [Sphingomonas sp. Leaf357]|uniref:oligosaccharide flippase family protein n=1 Tax=Sphingomonas sp. Leaf357 TaxID=1736350 RepID=UPI000700BBBC|nr:oligosaccharide flippase family protein [Sphingomonas sp. Leaf357]KQS04161.1 hypothetical protein ASG11_07785 [Sphingomonas sp. Leaf357]
MSTRRLLGWALGGQASSFVVTLLGSIILARLLSPREMGVYAIAVATVGILSILSTAGPASYVIREKEMPELRLRTAMTITFALNALIAIAIYAVSFRAGPWLGDPGVGPVLRCLALIPLIQILEFRPAAMMQREMQFRASTTIATSTALLTSAGQVTLAWLGYSYMSMAYASLAAALFSAIANNIVGRQHMGFRLSVDNWRPIAMFGARMLTISGVAALSWRICELVLGKMLGLTALGLYSRASNISNMIFFNIYGTASRFAFTKLSKDYREHGSVTTSFVISLEMIVSVMWPLLAGSAILAGPIIVNLYGIKWVDAAPVLSLLLASQIVVLAFGMNWELFVIHDEIKKQTRFEAIRAAFGTAAFAIGCTFSISAAATGRIVEALFGLILYLPSMSRLSGAAPARIFRLYGRSAVLTGAACLPAALLMSFEGWNPRTPLPLCLASVALGVGLWIVSLKLTRHPLLDELTRFLRHRRNGSVQPA